MNVQFTVGTVNFTDWLHITVVRVRDSVLVWEDWFDMPVSSLVFQATGLNADNYYVNFYDSPDNSSLGTLHAQCVISGLSAQYQYELRFYDYNNLPGTAAITAADTVLTDSYLAGKLIHSIDKVGYLLLEDTVDYSYVSANGEITLLNGLTLNPGEKMCVVIQNNIGTQQLPVGAMFAGTVNVTTQNYTVSAADKNKRFRCIGAATSQSLTLPALALFSDDDFLFFDNTVGGVARQPKIILPGTDRVLFNGWDLTVNELDEIWVGRGETLRLQKYTYSSDEYWEVIGDYAGIHVGVKVYNTSRKTPNALPNNGTLYTAAELPRLIWWGENILQDKIIDDTITSGSWARPANKQGVFAFTSTYSHVRFPDTQNLAVRNLKSFTSFGSDAERGYDAPGGFQAQRILNHKHEGTIGTLPIVLFGRGPTARIVGTYNPEGSHLPDLTSNPIDDGGNSIGSTKMSVENVGYIEYTRI